MRGSESLLDDLLPLFDVRQVHEAWLPAPADVVYSAVKQARWTIFSAGRLGLQRIAGSGSRAVGSVLDPCSLRSGSIGPTLEAPRASDS